MILTLGTTPCIQQTMSFATLAIDEVNRATSVRRFASGKSLNVARVLHTIGEDVIATGVVGGDSGRFIRRDLDGANLRHAFIESNVETRTCLTILDEANKTATELIEEQAAIEPRVFDALLDKLVELLTQHRGDRTVLTLSGKLAPGAGDDFYAKCLRLARDAGVTTILDAVGPALTLTLPEHPTVIKPNRRELEASVGLPLESDEAVRESARRLVSSGAKWVVVTNGGRDTLVSDGFRLDRIKVPKVDVVNPIGSGDSFTAGLAAGLRRGEDVVTACRLATACAAANAMTSDAGHVRKEDVDALVVKLSREQAGNAPSKLGG